MQDTITCTYRVGAQSVLPQGWQGQNLRLPDSKFYYVEKGEIFVEIYGRTILAIPGDLLLIPANTVHSCRLTEKLYAEKSWCHFSLKNGSREFFESYNIPPVIHIKDRAVINKLFGTLFSSHNMDEDQKGLVAATAICGLVQYYLEHSNTTRTDTGTDRIKKVIAYMNSHYTENITLQQLSGLAGYSPAHLSKCFRDATGVPPIRYFNNVRIEQAKYLLQYSDDTVGRVMERCGFSDAAYFSRAFKKVMGYSPQAFRELYRTTIPTKK